MRFADDAYDSNFEIVDPETALDLGWASQRKYPKQPHAK
jgi:hypothetical protein